MTDARTERERAAAGLGCLGKAADDEPVFILRAQDKLAAPLVRLWAELAMLNACDILKCQEAHELAEDMQDWASSTGRAKFPD